jgi:acetyl esterase/lipase
MSHLIKRAACGVAAALLQTCSRPTSDVGGAQAATEESESVASVSSCPDAAGATSAIRETRDVTYVTRGGRALRFDIAWSETGPAAPLVLLLHGGSWSGGSRVSFHDEMRALARRGYTAAAIEYRLTAAPRDVFPAAVADVRCALRTLRRRAADYNIAPAKVAALGYSAGGHLASMLGVAADVGGLDEQGCDASAEDVRVQAVVSYAGPQDLRVNGPYTQEQADIVTNFLGVFPGDAPAIARLASPIAHVNAGDPPFLMLHGTDDPLVPVDHARRMSTALRAVGTPASLIELGRVGHGYVGTVTSGDATVRCTVDAFLTRWLK